MGKRKRPPKLPPFGDPRWCPMQDDIEARERQTRSIPLAVTELEDEMRSGKRHSMRVGIVTRVPEPLKDSFWIDHEIDVIRVAGFEPIRIYRRTRERRPGEPRRWGDHMPFDDNSRVRVDGYAYYVWKPGLDRLYGAQATATSQQKPTRKRVVGDGAPLRPRDRAKAVLRNLYPNKERCLPCWRRSLGTSRKSAKRAAGRRRSLTRSRALSQTSDTGAAQALSSRTQVARKRTQIRSGLRACVVAQAPVSAMFIRIEMDA